MTVETKYAWNNLQSMTFNGRLSLGDIQSMTMTVTVAGSDVIRFDSWLGFDHATKTKFKQILGPWCVSPCQTLFFRRLQHSPPPSHTHPVRCRWRYDDVDVDIASTTLSSLGPGCEDAVVPLQRCNALGKRLQQQPLALLLHHGLGTHVTPATLG